MADKSASSKVRDFFSGPTGAAMGAIVGLAVGALVGRFMLAPTSSNVTNLNSTTLKSENMRQIVCSYDNSGQSDTVTFGDVIKATGVTPNADGTYDIPTADDVILVVRNRVLDATANREGIKVTDEDLEKEATETYGAESLQDMATRYGYEPDQLKVILSRAIINQKLQERVAGKIPEQPTYPDEPEAGKESEATKAYADYILSLAGDRWDGEGWGDPNGIWATTMSKSETFTPEAATHEDALLAYQAAYQEYTEAYGKQQDTWRDYANDLYKGVTIHMGTIAQ